MTQAPSPARPTQGPAGDPGSAAALRRLKGQLASVRAQALQSTLRAALAALKAGRRDAAAAKALKALEIDEACGLGWHILAICREKAGDFTHALAAYEKAVGLLPQEPEIACDLGRLALRMGMADIAERLFANYLLRVPGSIEGINNLACAQRDLMKFGDAIETLRGAIQANPASALLWNALGSVLTLQGDMGQALIFYDEAIRLQPGSGQAHYNRSIARLAEGDHEGALTDLDSASRLALLPADAAGLKVARAKALLASGDLAAGWDAYEARLDADYEDAIAFDVALTPWTPDTDLAGKRLLLIGEQGLGDEVLFAHAVPDLIAATGENGGVGLAVDPRLTALISRSFPDAQVGAHGTSRSGDLPVRTAPFADMAAYDLYAPLASPLRVFRRDSDAFGRGAFLKADPEQVAAWRRPLAELPGLKVGILWKSLVMDADRIRHFAPFDAWRQILSVPGVTFVNLQYGDSAAEMALSRNWGAPLWTPPGLDLKDDLDGVAALASALDLTIGPANAATNIAAACGAPVWLISTPHAWPRLGRADYPWYPQVQVFTPSGYGRWEPVMAAVAEALGAWGKG